MIKDLENSAFSGEETNLFPIEDCGNLYLEHRDEILESLGEPKEEVNRLTMIILEVAKYVAPNQGLTLNGLYGASKGKSLSKDIELSVSELTRTGLLEEAEVASGACVYRLSDLGRFVLYEVIQMDKGVMQRFVGQVKEQMEYAYII